MNAILYLHYLFKINSVSKFFKSLNDSINGLNKNGVKQIQHLEK
jgi:hypothetical protein